MNQQMNATTRQTVDLTRDESRRTAGDLLPDDLRMDVVTLSVGNLEGMTAYYRDALGLTELADTRHHADGGPVSVVLGRGSTPLVVLEHRPGLPEAPRQAAGLFHTAILFDSQAELAATVLNAARHSQSQFVGSSDHLVSEAFYFTDPEGNGIELYWDRPRETWDWTDGQVAMDTVFLDPNSYLRTHLTGAAPELVEGTGLADRGAEVGHVHLQVGDVETARSFYVDALGFEQTTALPGALFVSAGGYHHHMAMNVWNSRGAGPRAASLGLGDVRISLPARSDVEAVAQRLRDRRIEFQDDGAALRVLDPWKTPVTLAAE
ncbi:VOC family protein [Brevibacterium daeguense]|uniref:VOC family protein n=1 Tax=Brevibacterium daeguense TaxID=909936 RepID=A0ABP8EIY3_9MICO